MLTRLWSSIMGGQQSTPLEVVQDKYVLGYIKKRPDIKQRLSLKLGDVASVKEILETDGKIILQVNNGTSPDEAKASCVRLVDEFIIGFMSFEEDVQPKHLKSAKNVLSHWSNVDEEFYNGKVRITGTKNEVHKAINTLRNLSQPRTDVTQSPSSSQCQPSPLQQPAIITPVSSPQHNVSDETNSPANVNQFGFSMPQYQDCNVSNLPANVNQGVFSLPQNQDCNVSTLPKNVSQNCVDNDEGDSHTHERIIESLEKDIITSEHCVVESYREYVAKAPDQKVAMFIKFSEKHYKALQEDVEGFATVYIRKEKKLEDKFVYSYRKERQVVVHDFASYCQEKLNNALKLFMSEQKYFNKIHYDKAFAKDPSYFKDRSHEENHQLFVQWYNNKVVVCGLKEEVTSKIEEITEHLKNLVPRTYKHHFSLKLMDQNVAQFINESEHHTKKLKQNMHSISRVSIQLKSEELFVHFNTINQVTEQEKVSFENDCKSQVNIFFKKYSGCKIDCDDVLIKQIHRKCDILHGNVNVCIKVEGAAVCLVGENGAVHQKKSHINSKIQELKKRCQMAMIRDLSQYEISQNRCFVYKCTGRETEILRFVVDCNLQAINAALNELGNVLVDPRGGKIVIELHVGYRGVFSDCSSYVGTFFDQYDVIEMEERSDLLHRIRKNDPNLFTKQGDIIRNVFARFRQNQVFIIGEKDKCEKKMVDIEKAINALRKSSSAKPVTPKKVTTLKETCSTQAILIYTNCGIEKHLKTKYGNDAFHCSVEQQRIEIQGADEDVEKIQCELRDLNKKLVQKSPEISDHFKIQFLKKIFSESDSIACELQSKINEYLLKNNSNGLLIYNNDVELVTNGNKEFDIASKMLEQFVKHEAVEATDVLPETFDLKEWKEVFDTRIDTQVFVQNEMISVVGICHEEIQKLMHNIRVFLDDYKHTKSEFQCEEELSKFFINRCSLELLSSVEISFTPTVCMVEGPHKHVQQVSEMFRSLSAKYHLFELEVSAPGLSAYLHSVDWVNFTTELEERKCCKVFVKERGQDPSATDQKVQTSSVVIPKDECFYGKIKVVICQGDITLDNSDVIINGCRKDFHLDWGTVSKAIFEKAGPQIQDQCKNSPVQKSNMVRVTDGWNLLCKFVVHVVTPHSIEPLAERIKEALEYAELIKASSVAIPTIGAGAIGLDINDVGEAFSKAIDMFAETNPVMVKTIKIVIFEGAVVSSFKRHLVEAKTLRQIGPQQMNTLKTLNQILEPEMLSVCCTNDSELLEVHKLVEEHIKQATCHQPLQYEEIKEFTEHEWIDIYQTAMKYCVVVYQQNPCEVTLYGLTENVRKMEEFIKNLVFEFQKSTFMYQKTCTWKWSVSGKNLNLPARVGRLVEDAHERRETECTLTLYGSDIKINLPSKNFFYHGLQGNISRSVSDWQDLPPNWEHMEGNKVLKVIVPASSYEYQRVVQLFAASGPRYTHIDKIQRIQNPSLYQKYEIHKRDIEHHMLTQNPVERDLFHGTSYSVAEKICDLGFDRGFCGKNATVYGKGVYFAKNSKFSIDYCDQSGVKQMFLAKVLTGDYCLGSGSYNAPPSKSGTEAAYRLYDSVVNDVTAPYIFVVFNDASAYPTYLITFF